MSIREALAKATEAKATYWDAMTKLESALGYSADMPDEVFDYLLDKVEGLVDCEIVDEYVEEIFAFIEAHEGKE